MMIFICIIDLLIYHLLYFWYRFFLIDIFEFITNKYYYNIII